MCYTRAYGESEDGKEWALRYLERSGLSAKEMMNEIWPHMMEQYGDEK